MAASGIIACAHVIAIVIVIMIHLAVILYFQHQSFLPVRLQAMAADAAMIWYSRAVLPDLETITIPADARKKRTKRS